MTDCDDLLDELHRLTRTQIDLAIIAGAPPVAAMYLDLALFGAEQARFVEELCDQD